jgi:dimethylaniline monooxygenase (N-oxide forming)
MTPYSEVKTVGIIGAGVAGLATARSLMAQGLQCTLFESNNILGGVWSDGYLNFGVQVQKELYEFPDWPLPDDTPDFTKGPVIQKYLEDFADNFDITPNIRLNTTVTKVGEVNGSGSGWFVEHETHGKKERSQFDLMVICIGLYSNTPNMPSFPNIGEFSGDVIHNSRLKSLDQLTGKRVAVVGYGKSATDAALEAAEEAIETHLIFRKPNWPIPQKLAGILPFKWGLLHRLNISLLPPYQNASVLVKTIHSFGKPLVWFYWRLVETLLYFQCQLGSRFGSRVSLAPQMPIEVGAFSESTMIAKGELFTKVRAGAIEAHRTTISEYTTTGLKLDNGESLDLDLVILATGWKTNFDFIDGSVLQRLNQEEDGFYLYRHIYNPDIPGLFFIGRAASVSSILTYSLQSHWLGELIRGIHELPSEESMKRNVEEMKEWKRSWMPFSSARSARLIAHSQNYHDELLSDIKVSPFLKTGKLAPLKELIVPYQPSDYASLFTSDG